MASIWSLQRTLFALFLVLAALSLLAAPAAAKPKGDDDDDGEDGDDDDDDDDNYGSGPLSVVRGRIFTDNNGNGAYNPNTDAPLAGVRLAVITRDDDGGWERSGGTGTSTADGTFSINARLKPRTDYGVALASEDDVPLATFRSNPNGQAPAPLTIALAPKKTTKTTKKRKPTFTPGPKHDRLARRLADKRYRVMMAKRRLEEQQPQQ